MFFRAALKEGRRLPSIPMTREKDMASITIMGVRVNRKATSAKVAK
jgi:hypothetical protein